MFHVTMKLMKTMRVSYHKLPVGKTFPEKPEYVWELEALKRTRLEEELASKFHPDAKKALRRFWSMP